VRVSPSPEGRWRSGALLALALLALGGRGAAAEPGSAQESTAAETPIAAVWKKEEVLFTYQSSIAIYTCDALQNRVASLLYAVGARPDLEVKVTGCSHSVVPMNAPAIDRTRRAWEPGSGTSYVRPAESQQISTVHVLLSMPVEMTPDVVAELNADKSRRELISRVTGNPIPRFDDPIPFAAERRVVTLNYKTARLEAAECELLDQLVTSSFRNLGLRVVRQGYTCSRNRVSNIRPSLDVEALVPMQYEPEKPRTAPAEAGEDAGKGAPAPTDAAPPEPGTDAPPE
jgi:hypothetical protein